MTAHDRWLESPYTDVEEIECDDCDKCTNECTSHEYDDAKTADEGGAELAHEAWEEDRRNGN